MKRILSLCLLLMPLMAFAQQATVVSSCATGRVPPKDAGNQVLLMVDTAGNLCSNPGGGGATSDVNIDQVNGSTANSSAGPTLSGTQRVVEGGSTTAATTTTLLAGASAVISAACTTCTARWISNNGSATAYVKYGAAAASGDGIPLTVGASLVEDDYTGEIRAFGTGNITVQAVTP